MRYRKCGPPRFIFFFFAIAAIFVFSAIVMWLWNGVLPDLLNVNVISYWQAMGLLVLCKILFGFRGPGGGRRFGPNHELREKFRNMSEEDREKFKQEWRQRCRMRPWKKDE